MAARLRSKRRFLWFKKKRKEGKEGKKFGENGCFDGRSGLDRFAGTSRIKLHSVRFGTATQISCFSLFFSFFFSLNSYVFSYCLANLDAARHDFPSPRTIVLSENSHSARFILFVNSIVVNKPATSSIFHHEDVNSVPISRSSSCLSR